MLATDVYFTGLAEAKGWPDPILEVQWVAATIGCAPEDKGARVLGTAEPEVAVITVLEELIEILLLDNRVVVDLQPSR